ncbi:uncharacterized protein LOC110038708, partial [Phalaenopsis equestris]|uniref:uncharacterized protein LOC110038708 n=1 Tax=Phalaenopsis equestris TaxID=78828 RepID=UPI0009E654C5
MVKWQLPLLEWVKINTDGNSNQRSASLRGVVHNHSGRFLLFFSSPCIEDSAGEFEAHANAILMVVTIAVSLNWSNILIKTDSKILFEMFNQGKLVTLDDCYHINRIIRLSSIVPILWRFIHHEGNKSANWVSKCGASTSTILVDTVLLSPLQ